MLDLIKGRRSIRAYTGDDVTDEQVRALLEAAMAAPSASNKQPWEFVVVRDPQRRLALARLKQWSYMCEHAPVVFAVLADGAASAHWVSDASAATENLLLAATGLGLGGVWIAIYPRPELEAQVRQILEIPDRLRVLCLVAVGHPAEVKPPRTQYKDSKVHHDVYGNQ
jgi:nitroreductase